MSPYSLTPPAFICLQFTKLVSTWSKSRSPILHLISFRAIFSYSWNALTTRFFHGWLLNTQEQLKCYLLVTSDNPVTHNTHTYTHTNVPYCHLLCLHKLIYVWNYVAHLFVLCNNLHTQDTYTHTHTHILVSKFLLGNSDIPCQIPKV